MRNIIHNIKSAWKVLFGKTLSNISPKEQLIFKNWKIKEVGRETRSGKYFVYEIIFSSTQGGERMIFVKTTTKQTVSMINSHARKIAERLNK